MKKNTYSLTELVMITLACCIVFGLLYRGYATLQDTIVPETFNNISK